MRVTTIIGAENERAMSPAERPCEGGRSASRMSCAHHGDPVRAHEPGVTPLESRAPENR